MAHLLSLLALFSGHGHISHAESLRAFAASHVPANTRHSESLRAFAASKSQATPGSSVRHAQCLRAFAA